MAKKNNMDEALVKVVHRVKVALFDKKLNYDQAAKLLGMSRSAFVARMRGVQPFDLPQMVQISKITGLPLDHYLGVFDDFLCQKSCK